jgi:hypothetical protein
MRLAAPALVGSGNGAKRRPPAPKRKTVQFRKWKGANLTDARTAIGDDEFSWCENALTIGDGAIQILPGPGPTIATLTQGVASLWGLTLNGSPVMIAINRDGSISQITPGGNTTVVAGSGTVTPSARVTIWQGSPILIVDPTFGYFSWDGTTFTLIDATRVGTALAVFQGRVWIANNRTTTYTAPNTYNDFTAGNGSGSFVLTDEAFPGNIVTLVSALEELWLVGQAAIDALSNVTASGVAPNVVTTFSVTNIVTNVGSNASGSVVGYFRALALLAPFGAYALSGVTPQKLSDKLDGMFPDLLIGDTTAMAAVAVVQNLPVLLFRVTYTGQQAKAGAGPIALLLGFTQGKWFFAVQRPALSWITTVIVNGVAQAWGTDGTTVYQLFGASPATPVNYRLKGKLSDFGLATTAKALTKAGLELQASYTVAPVFTVESETSASVVVPVAAGAVITWVNALGQVITWVNALNQEIVFVAQGRSLSRSDAALFGHYLGWSLEGTDPPYSIQAIALEYEETRPWSHP